MTRSGHEQSAVQFKFHREGRRERPAEAAHLQAIEANPLTAEEIAMSKMFERER